MTDRTITAMYNDKMNAERACDQLKAAGFDQVDIHDQDGLEGTAPQARTGFMEKMKAFFEGNEDAPAYGEGLRRGHCLLTAHVRDNQADRAIGILEASNAIDFDRSQKEWRSEGWSPETNEAARDEPVMPPAGERLESNQRARDEQVIPLAEERLRVGKREIERGGVKVRSYVVETPVHDQVSLRDEHVSVDRRPVDRPVGAGDDAFKDRNVEVTETAEEAVIAKDAVVREEVVVRKESSERQQGVDEKVRRTEVEINDTTGRSDQKTPPPAPRF